MLPRATELGSKMVANCSPNVHAGGGRSLIVLYAQLSPAVHVAGHEIDLALHQAADEMDVGGNRSSFAMTSFALCFRQAVRAFSSSGRSERLPLSTSVNSPTSFHRPPFK